ncbi:L10e/P0, partial [Apostichopus japonicus]
NLLDEYPKCFIVRADNVGSKQMQQIRISLRGQGIVLMGKNTIMRKAIRGHLEHNPNLESLLPHLKGNVGLVFCKGDLADVRTLLLQNKVAAPAKAGAIAPVDVMVPAQNTGLGPEKTSFFQALSIATKISRGSIEILNTVHLIKVDEKVGASEATLLSMLKIFPFSYGLVIENVYDNGSVFQPNIWTSRMLNFTKVPRERPCSGLPTDIEFKEAEQAKAFIADPSAFVAAAPAQAAEEAPREAAKEEKKEESDSESDDDMGFGLFD